MALFTGTREQQVELLKSLPTDRDVKNGIAISYNAQQELLKAFADGNFKKFDYLIGKEEQNFSSDLQNTLSKLGTAQLNLANSTDYSGLTPEQIATEKASLDPSLQNSVDNWLDALAQYKNLFPTADIPEPEGYVRTESGYKLASEVQPASTGTSDPANMGKTGEGLRIRQLDDGLYEVYGVSTGKVYQSGIKDLNEALSAQTTIQSGATPGATPVATPTGGAGVSTSTDIGGITADGSTGYRSSILDGAGVNYNGLSESEIKDLEAMYSNAGNSTSLMDKVFSMQEITADDTKNFLDEAREFITGKGSAYEQSFTRARENYERTIENQALNRKLQMEQEELAKQEALTQTAESAADTGTAFSGIRRKAEGKIQEQARNIAESSRRAFDFGTGSYQRETEDYLGSKALTGAKLPAIEGVDIPSLTPGIRGSLERQAETDVQLKADALQAQAQTANKEILAGEGGTTLF